MVQVWCEFKPCFSYVSSTSDIFRQVKATNETWHLFLGKTQKAPTFAGDQNSLTDKHFVCSLLGDVVTLHLVSSSVFPAQRTFTALLLLTHIFQDQLNVEVRAVTDSSEGAARWRIRDKVKSAFTFPCPADCEKAWDVHRAAGAGAWGGSIIIRPGPVTADGGISCGGHLRGLCCF